MTVLGHSQETGLDGLPEEAAPTVGILAAREPMGRVLQLQGPPRPRDRHVEEAPFFFQLPALQRPVVGHQTVGDPQHKHVIPLAAFGGMDGGEGHSRRVERNRLRLEHALQMRHRRHAARRPGPEVQAIAQVLVVALATVELEVGEASLGKPTGQGRIPDRTKRSSCLLPIGVGLDPTRQLGAQLVRSQLDVVVLALADLAD